MKLQKSMLQIAWMYLIITMIWPHNFIFSAEIDSLFNQGNEHYSLGEYEMAINNYENCLQLSQSAALHFNIGNAWYQIDEVGKAILHFEKALALNPGYPEAQANLKFVRENSDLALPEYSWVSRLAQTLSLSTWCWIGAVSFWAVIALITLPRLFGGGNLFTFGGMLLSLILSLCTVVALYGYHNKNNEVVILNNDTTLRVAPTDISPSNAYLQGGELASMERTHQKFLFLKTAQGESGWVLAEEIGKIWK